MNDRAPQETYPPSWVWQVAVVVATLLIISLFLKILSVEYEFTEFNQYNRKRVHTLLAMDVDIRIVVAGDSRIRYSIDPALFQAEVEKQLGLTTSIVTITANRGVWGKIHPSLVPLLNAQSFHSETPPVVLLLDDNMFAKEWTWLHDFRFRRDFSIWSLLGQGVWRRDGGPGIQEFMQNDLRCEGWLYTEETPEARVRRVSEFFRMDPDGENSQKLNAFVEAVSKKGGHVATLYVPPQPGGEPIVWHRPTDTITLDVEFQPEPSLYCDPVHLNKRGREVFTKNLAQAFSDWLRK